MVFDILHVAYQVILPVFCIMSLGSLVQRFHALDIRTLVTLIIYVFVPCYIFVRILESQLTLVEVVQTGSIVLMPMLIAGGIIWLVCRQLNVAASSTSTMIVASVFFNAGNLGIPVAELAHGEAGGAVQAIVMIFVGTPTFVFGYLILSRGKGRGWLESIQSLLRLPYLYALVFALVLRNLGWSVPQPMLECLHRVKDGMIPVALFTLGAQLVANASWPNWKIVAPVVFCKLVMLPLLATVLVVTMGLWPWPGAQLILAAAAPTAVNTLLLAIEVDGNAKDAADCIFWTTIVSILTLPIVLAIIQSAAGPGLPNP